MCRQCENIANALLALKAKDQVALSTMRLIVAALKDVILRAEMIIPTVSLRRNWYVANHDKTTHLTAKNLDGDRPELANEEAEIEIIENFSNN